MRGGLWCFLVVLNSCSTWKEPDAAPFELPATRMSHDSVALEITFVRVPVGEPAINERLWQQVDEQWLPAEQRLHLNRNGFRCGLLGTSLPDELRDLLGKQEQAARLDQLVNTQMDVLAQNREVSSRAGQRTEIVTSPPRPEMVVLHKELSAQKVSGSSFQDAQCILAARSFPKGDGTVSLELTPEVHHGTPRQQWIAGEGTFQLLSGREREVFQDLVMGITLAAGQTALLSCTPDLKGLGQNFFVETGRGDPQQKLLLIRLAQTQRDDLFETAAAK
jgi:hypothetical protein